MKKTQKGDTMILSDFFQQHPQAAIGFSGGVDSSYLAYCAKKYAQNILAIYYKSECLQITFSHRAPINN